MKVVIVAIAKMEQDYIEEWVKYHLHLGVDKIFLYDNEDVPFYEKFLQKYSDKLKVFHLPGNNYNKGVQYIALDDFTGNHMLKDGITHVAHIDIDEFIVLKKHSSIQEFVREYIKDGCGGIGMNWRLFGDSGLKTQTEKSVLNRFTKTQLIGNQHIKTIFDVKCFKDFIQCHSIQPLPGYNILSTDGRIIQGAFNKEPNLDVIQLNHYKSKTFEEFQEIMKRGRAGKKIGDPRNIVKNIKEFFDIHNKNEIEDMWAYNVWQSIKDN
jgi:hypothetical protein